MKQFIIVILISISISVYSQSPWTQKKEKAYSQISFTSISNYDTLFGNPDYNTFGNFTDNTIQIFTEYGLSDKTSLVVNIPLKLISIKDFQDPRIDCVGDCSENYNKTALGNIEIGLKHNFYKKDWIISGQLSVEANTSAYEASSGIRTGYDAWSFTPLLLAGRGFEKTYFQGFIGANIRTNDYSANFKIGGEIGRKITNKIWIIGFLDIVKSLENGNIVLPIQNNLTGLYVNNQEYGSFGLKGIGEITDQFGMTAGFGGAFFGNNVAQAPALTFGLYHKF